MKSIPEGAVPVNLIGPSRRVLKMCSGKEKSLLGPGEFQLLRDLRCDDGLPKWRNREATVLSRPSWATSALPLGRAAIKLNDERYVAAAWYDGSKVRIALAPVDANGSPVRWVDVCGGGSNQWGGPSGDPRLSNTTAAVNFAVVSTPRYMRSSQVDAARDVLVINNGEDEVRIFDRKKLTASRTITGATNASPIVVTTSGNHNLATGDAVWIQDVLGNNAANGLWNVIRLTATTFSLTGSTGSGVWTSGGTAAVPFLGTHKPVTVPDGGATPTAYAFLSQFLGVSTASGISRTYAAAGVINQNNRFEFQDSTAGYTGSNATMECLIGNTVATNDEATVQTGSSFGLLGKHAYLWLQGAYADTLLKNVRIEINQENVARAAIATPWVEIYNPNSVEPLRKKLISLVTDTTERRTLYAIPLGAVSQSSGDRAVYHVRMVWLGNTPAPATAQTVYFLMFGSASGPDFDNGFPADSEWEISYEDNYSWAESASFPCQADAFDLGQIGGPKLVTDGSGLAAAPKLPLDSRFFYDFSLPARNSDAATPITGGLEGEPSQINYYLRLPGKEKAYFAFELQLFAPGFSGATRVWANGSTSLNATANTSDSLFYRREFANSNRENPSEFQQTIPIAGAMGFHNGRLHVGAIKERAGEYDFGGVYVSWDRNPFRFQQVQEDERRGTYFQIAGEKVLAFRNCGAASLGAGRTFLWTDKSFGTIGDPSPNAQALVGVSELGRYSPIGNHGTQSPLSIAQGYNSLFWYDAEAQLMRLSPAGLENLGKGEFHDRLEGVPIARKARVCGVFRGDRLYMGITPALGSTNARALVWNSWMGGLESEDQPENAFEMAFLWDAPAGTRSLARLFFFHSDGTLMAYEETTTGTVSAQLLSSEYGAPEGEWDEWSIDEVQATVTHNTGGSLTVSRISRRWGADEPYTSSLSVDETGADFATYRDSLAKAKTGTDRGPESDRKWALQIGGALAPGSQLTDLDFAAVGTGVSSGKR
jgi:hypothetical protein